MFDPGHTVTLLMIGIGMIALTIIINVSGMVILLEFLARHLQQHYRKGTQPNLFKAILSTVIVLLVIHMIESFLWAILYLLLPGRSGLENLHDAFYFSVITITTLGYGDITLDPPWHILSGFESMIGIIVFGMSTALILMVVQKCWVFTHEGPTGSAED